jgi:hypothetical protein
MLYSRKIRKLGATHKGNWAIPLPTRLSVVPRPLDPYKSDVDNGVAPIAPNDVQLLNRDRQ